MKDWLTWEEDPQYNVEAVSVGSHSNITNDKENEPLFVSCFDGKGPFNREEPKQPIGFKYL